MHGYFENKRKDKPPLLSRNLFVDHFTIFLSMFFNIFLSHLYKMTNVKTYTKKVNRKVFLKIDNEIINYKSISKKCFDQFYQKLILFCFVSCSFFLFFAQNRLRTMKMSFLRFFLLTAGDRFLRNKRK